MKKLETYGTIKSGRLHISYRDRFEQSLSLWPDCRVKVIVEKIYNKRSLDANAYYWSVIINEFCVGFLEMTGEKITKEEAHDFLKNKFNYVELTNPSTGEVEHLGKTTTQLTTVQFMEYQNECIRFIAEWFGRTCPEPGEQTELEL